MQEWKGDKGGSGRKTAVKAAVKELRRGEAGGADEMCARISEFLWRKCD